MSFDVGAFISVPIKLAAIIRGRREGSQQKQPARSIQAQVRPTRDCRPTNRYAGLVAMLLLPLLAALHQATAAEELRQRTHYLNMVPSTHFRYDEGRQLSLVTKPTAPEQQEPELQHLGSSHIYKRSSALISAPGHSHYPPLVGSMQPAANPLRRRMMSEARWTAGESSEDPASQPSADHQQSPAARQQQHPASEESAFAAAAAAQPAHQKEAELLRQKQHIQYHDQWPSMAGKCHKRTLNFCASVLPFNTTTFPNIIGDTNRFEVKRSLPFFGFLAKSSCNKRLDELLCLLLEPPCQPQSGAAIPPCKKFCRLALEGCNEYIPATLAMSSVFDCRQYPDSNDPSVCVNLARGSKCASDEFKCPDKTCIPRNWLCDGVRDCIFAADEANCTAWKCDGERDCLDGSDEETCDQRPKCGPDRFRCADGNGCLPKRWVCDGKAECRDGSDEMNCEQRECSETDFKCDNGICIPKLWRCDRQSDCKDNSDERNCIYPTASSTPTPTTTVVTAGESYANVSRPASLEPELILTASPAVPPSAAQAAIEPASTGRQQQQLEQSLNDDIARIIQQESSSSVAPPPSLTSSEAPVDTPPVTESKPSEMNKFDYDIIHSSAAPFQQPNELAGADSRPLLTQIDFVPQQQQPQQQQQQQQQHYQQLNQQALFRLQRERATRAFGSAPATPNVLERVPIYRSLFKTLKGSPGRVPPASLAAQHRFASGTHRKRGRYQPQQVQQQTTLPVPMGAASEEHGPTSSPAPAFAERNESGNASPTPVSASRSQGVASYLQLLNSRYNLRLARVAPTRA